MPPVMSAAFDVLRLLVRANPVVRGFSLREEGQVELLRKTPYDLPRAQSCQGPTDNVNAIFVNRPFQFDKRSQLFIGAHDETFSVVTVCISNPDCSPALRDAFSVFVPDINTNRSVGRLKCFSRKTSGV